MKMLMRWRSMRSVSAKARRRSGSGPCASEGSGIANVPPTIVSLGGPYVSRGGSDVQLSIDVQDPDSAETVSWRMTDDGPCDDAQQRFGPTQLVQNPKVLNLPAANGTCRVEVFVHDGRARVVTATISISVNR